MGNIGQQSKRPVLILDRERPKDRRRAGCELAAHRFGHGPHLRSTGGGREMIPSWLYQTLSRIRSLFSKSQLDRQLKEELATHIDLATEENKIGRAHV